MRVTAKPGERRFPRVDFADDTAIPIDVWNRDVAAMTGRVKVLGAGGAFVELGRYLPVGSYIELRFRVPGVPDEIQCGGLVRDRVPGQGIGIEFTGLAYSERDRVAEAVNQALQAKASSAPLRN